MGISAKTRKMLWGRAASRCSIADCRIELVMDPGDTDDPSLVGEECHIVAREDGGPRGLSKLSPDKRDLYSNLILLCCNHHKLVDDRSDEYPVEVLQRIKSEHEEWVRSRLGPAGIEEQRDEERYAAIVDEWARRADLDSWESWTSSLMSHGHPRLPAERLEGLSGLNQWLFKVVWPRRHEQLEAGFENFRRVLNDLVRVFGEAGHEVGFEEHRMWQVEKRYQRLERWDPPAYARLEKAFDRDVGRVQDLTVELTRAANLVCSLVRQSVLANYRLSEGLLVLTAGPFMDLSFKTYRPQYAPDVDPSTAYPGVPEFFRIRFSRDLSFGEEKDEV